MIPEFEGRGRRDQRVSRLMKLDAPWNPVPDPRQHEIGVDAAQESHDRVDGKF